MTEDLNYIITSLNTPIDDLRLYAGQRHPYVLAKIRLVGVVFFVHDAGITVATVNRGVVGQVRTFMAVLHKWISDCKL